MNKFLFLLLLSPCICFGQGIKFSSLPTTSPDSTSYIIGIKNVGGNFVNYKFPFTDFNVGVIGNDSVFTKLFIYKSLDTVPISYNSLVSGLLANGGFSAHQLNTVNSKNSEFFVADTLGNFFYATNYGDTAIGFSAQLGKAPNMSIETENGVDSIFFDESTNVNKIHFQDKSYSVAGLDDVMTLPTLQSVTNANPTTTTNVTISGATGNSLTVNSSGGNSILANSEIQSVNGSGNTAALDVGTLYSGSSLYNHELGIRNSSINPEIFFLDGNTSNYYHLFFPSSLSGLDRNIYMPLRNFTDTIALQSDIKFHVVDTALMTGQTVSTTVMTYTTPNSLKTYVINGHMLVTTFGTGTYTESVSFYDENNNLQTIGIISGSAAQYSLFHSPVSITCFPNTTITVYTTITLSIGTALYSTQISLIQN